MIESNAYTIDTEAWRLELLAVKRDILDCEPMAALKRIDVLIGLLFDKALSERKAGFGCALRRYD